MMIAVWLVVGFLVVVVAFLVGYIWGREDEAKDWDHVVNLSRGHKR